MRRGNLIMKTRKLPLALLALSFFYATSAHAGAASGMIHFSGLIYQQASASMDVQTARTDAPIATKKTDSLRDFRNTMQRDALDYFETYAGKDAKVVSVTYL
jgi:type 1 fimbria pilin